MSEANGAKRICSDGATIGTHDGTFHCDEVLACFMLRQLPEYQNATIFRSRDNNTLREKCDIIVDVGGVFEHAKKWYDHHQNSFQETLSTLRPEYGNDSNIRLSSAGLIYAYYGEQIINSILQRECDLKLSKEDLKIVYVQIYRNFLMEIDAIDNGVPMFEGGEPRYNISTHLSARISKLNPSWDEHNIDVDQRFEKAIIVAGQEFVQNVLYIGGSWINARNIVRHALKKAQEVYKSGEILFLETFCPWKSHLADLETEYEIEGVTKLIIFSANPTSWRVAGVPVSPGSYLGRKFLPLAWRGLREETLSEIAGIPDLEFVHHTGFIGGAKTKEAAVQMAIKSVEWQE